MSKAFVPTPWLLDAMVARAMAACDADVEQARLKREAERDARYVRAQVHIAKSRHLRAMYGDEPIPAGGYARKVLP